MEKFDPDFALFGILTASLLPGIEIGDAVVDYANESSMRLYGELRGKTIGEIIYEVAGEKKAAQEFVYKLGEGMPITLEGRLNKRYVKFHSTIVRYCLDDSCGTHRFIQAGIMDITESVVLKKLLYGTSEALKRAATAADEDTGHHVTRINLYSGKFAELLKLDENFIDDIGNYAQLHDIGKIKVADLVRLPRKLSAEEFAEVQKHTVYGAEIVAGLDGLEMARDIALDHHEKWDGSGYPNGKKGEDISLAGRIVAMADVFDALVSVRPYKPSFTYGHAYKIMTIGDDRVKPDHFDPELYKIFVNNYEHFTMMHKKMHD